MKYTKSFHKSGERIKESFFRHAPVKIEYILIVSDSENVSCDAYQNEILLGVPVHAYMATLRRLNLECEDSGQIDVSSTTDSGNRNQEDAF